MPIQKKGDKWYWGSQGPFSSREKAEDVAQAAYASGYKKSIDVFTEILQKKVTLPKGAVYSSTTPPPKGKVELEDERGTKYWVRDPRARTARAWEKTTVGTHVLENAKKDDAILDYGAGPQATQTKRLKDAGFKNVTAHDLPESRVSEHHTEDALDNKYDVVMASNVLNVQETDKDLTDTLKEMGKVLKEGGHIIANFPQEPRKHKDIQTSDQLESKLKDQFNVEKIKAGHWKLTNKSKGLQKIEMGALQEGVKSPTAGELNKPREVSKPKKKSDNMNSYKDLQNFYKENYQLEKAQTAKNPWAIARAIVDGTARGDWWKAMWGDQIDPNADEDEKRSMMGRIVAGIEQNKWNKMLKSIDIQKKLSPAMAALAGWWLGGEIQEIIQGQGQATPAQQREYERQIQRQMRRGIKKETDSMDDLQTFYSDANDTYIRRGSVPNGVDIDVQKAASYIKTSGGGSRLSAPPRPGETYNAFTHRWTKPENQTEVKTSQGGKARLDRASGTGTMERSVGGHGKGKVRETEAGRKGVTHGERLKPGFEHPEQKKQRSKEDAHEKDRKKTHSRNSAKPGTVR